MPHPSDQIPPASKGHRLGELGQDAMPTSDGPALPPYGPTREDAAADAAMCAERQRRLERFGDEFDDCRRPRSVERHAPSGRAHPASGMEDVMQHFERG